MHRNRAESPNVAAIKLNPESRLNAAQQLQIVDLFFAGYSYTAIARQLHRNRRTVSRICKSMDVQAMIQEQKAKLVAESDSWLESIDFAVTHELDGRLGYKLCEAFGIIPSLEKNVPAKKRSNQEVLERQRQALAIMLKMKAMRRECCPLEVDELEKPCAEGPGTIPAIR
jgi:Helix-turn-helix domain